MTSQQTGQEDEVETVSRHTGHKKDDGMTQEERWMVRYEEVMEFMVKEHRKPSKYYPEEKLKFHFIHHNKKLYNARTLKAERVEAFEKLLALCEEYKRVNQYV